jgi:hypothetical protein
MPSKREIAKSAWRAFAKRRHPAALKFGDCFTYAFGKWSGEPILSKGAPFFSHRRGTLQSVNIIVPSSPPLSCRFSLTPYPEPFL